MEGLALSRRKRSNSRQLIGSRQCFGRVYGYPAAVRIVARVRRGPTKPTDIEEHLEILLRGLRRLCTRSLTDEKERKHFLSRRSMAFKICSTRYYDPGLLISDLKSLPPVMPVLAREWIFSFRSIKLCLELKFVRDRNHTKKIGDELIVDTNHYQKHPECSHLSICSVPSAMLEKGP